MTELTRQLLDLLNLESIETNVFRGQNEPRQHHRLFGGQVLAQALAAAYRTVHEARSCHSLHGYFLRPGDSTRPVLYSVESIRDGHSFTTRRVKAIQKGEAIFSMDASFQVHESGLHHQIDLEKDWPLPETITDDHVAAVRKWGKQAGKWMRERPFEVRSVEDGADNAAASWIRFKERLDDAGAMHQLLLSYASDMSLISTAMIPHRRTMKPGKGSLQMASLDHALWFHRPFNVSDWLLYTRETPAAAGARGFTRGAFYSRQGELVASVMQEGLIRYRASSAAPQQNPSTVSQQE